MANRNIEKQVAEAVLQQAEEIHIGNKTYYAAPPSIATLILVSEAVSRLPVDLDPSNVIGETLSKAKDCRPLGEIVALFILGAKGAQETTEIAEKQRKKYLWGLIKRDATIKRSVRKIDVLANEVLEVLTPNELNLLTARLLQRMQIADFFGLTTFLTGVNLTRPTKVVEES